MVMINIDHCFPNKIIGDMNHITHPDFRKEIDHLWWVHQDFPLCGLLSRDEAHILFNAALSMNGCNALEIGSHIGWSTLHLALGGVLLDVIEPQLIHDPRVLLSLIQSINIAGLQQQIRLIPGFSPQSVHQTAQKEDKKWSLIFIDGNHNEDYPLLDAQACEQYAEETCMIFFHDIAFPSVAAGLLYLRDQGWNTKLYQTQQIMGVAWRGDIHPPVHTPDPRYNWTLPDHLKNLYHTLGEEIQ
eukprot:TRINITY_DN8847_c0_g1_i1.p1 TRINITY_DN8847_c0_g1~~TRINITY_DN8847_c0_g1_i1.p1  ORF type:complete len:272 (+),score=47.03 TRINITY_DN8847_c0_g1_i1:89-817(+)